MEVDHNDLSSFVKALEGMKSLSAAQNRRRDSRAIRLAAVVSAMLDVVSEDHKVSPAKVYTATLTALEGTLEQENASTNTLATQTALLELLTVTATYVSPAAVGATVTVASRVLQSVVTFCHTLAASGDGTVEIHGELGGISDVLPGVCRASTQILLQVPSTVADKTIQTFFLGTLLTLLEQSRPKIYKEAMKGTCEIVMGDASPCQAAIRKAVTSYTHSQLTRAKKRHSGHQDASHLLHILELLETSVLYLDSRRLGADVMELLVANLQDDTADSSDQYVANLSRRDTTSKILVVSGLLSITVYMMEDEVPSRKEILDSFTERVLASLLQSRPISALGQCEPSIANSWRTLYGRALVIACARVLSSNRSVGYKLLPLAIQMVIQLSRPSDEAPGVEVSQTLMVELTRLFREKLVPAIEEDKSQSEELGRCLQACLLGMEPLLQHSFRPTWSATLQALAFLLNLMESHHEKVSRMVEALILLRNDLSVDTLACQAVENALGSLIQGVGIERFWSWVTWQDETAKSRKRERVMPVISLDRAWLLSLMRLSASSAVPRRPHLQFFQSTVLDLARRCDSRSATASISVADAAAHSSRVVDLWALLPCFCKEPVDVESAFPSLAETLVRAMDDARYPQLATSICCGLTTLVRGIQERQTEDSGDDTSMAQHEAEVFGQVSIGILPSLFKLVETLNGTLKKPELGTDAMETDGQSDRGSANDSRTSQDVCETIAELARLAPKGYVQSLFKKVMQRLLAATQSADDPTEKICTLLGLSQALVCSEALDDSSVGLLYRAVKPFVRTDEYAARVQKKAYKVTLEICRKHGEFTSEPKRLKELTDLLVGSIMTCQVSARHMRLKCMGMIVDGLDGSNKQQLDLITKVVPEVLLCLKDSNRKTRESAYQLLLSMSTLQNDTTDFVRVVMAALGAQTPHMRSAAVMAMSRLVFEYSRVDEAMFALLPSLLQTVIVLFDEDSREVVKSAVSFVRVSVAAMSAEQLEPVLPELVGGLLKYHKGKDRFREKIKIILKKLVRLFGYETLMPLVPEADTRLLTHVRKLSERAARRKAAQRQHGLEEMQDFEELMESDEEDSDDGRTLMTGATGFTRMTAASGKSVRTAARERSTLSRQSIAVSTVASAKSRKGGVVPRLRAEPEGQVMDMLSPKMAKSVHFADGDAGDSDMDDGSVEFDEMGRLIVHDDMDETPGRKRENDAVDDEDEIHIPGKKRRLGKFESAKVTRDEAQKKKSRNQAKALGAEYKSKKAGGDVKRKGQKYEPYAFVPLDGKSYSKKNRRGTVEQMSSVVRAKGGKRKRSK